MKKRTAQLTLFVFLILGVSFIGVTLTHAGNKGSSGAINSVEFNPKPSCTPTPTDTATGSAILDTPVATSDSVVTPVSTPTNGNVVPQTSVNTSSPSQGSSQATCTTPIAAPLLQGFKRNSPTSVTFSYWPSKDASSYVLAYGYSKDNLPYGIPFIPSSQTSVIVNDLKPNVSVWGTVYAVNGACSSQSVVIDP
jgi:hypothetical protein